MPKAHPGRVVPAAPRGTQRGACVPRRRFRPFRSVAAIARRTGLARSGRDRQGRIGDLCRGRAFQLPARQL